MAAKLSRWIAANFPPRGGSYSQPDALSERLTKSAFRPRNCGGSSPTTCKGPSRTQSLTTQLVGFATNFLVTLNYDLLLQETATVQGRDVAVLLNTEDGLETALDLTIGPRTMASRASNEPHVHGCVTHPDRRRKLVQCG